MDQILTQSYVSTIEVCPHDEQLPVQCLRVTESYEEVLMCK